MKPESRTAGAHRAASARWMRIRALGLNATGTSAEAFAPVPGLCRLSKAGRIRVLPTTRRPVGVLTLKRRSRSLVAQLFIDGIRQVAKPLASDC